LSSSQLPTLKSPGLVFLVNTSPYRDWVIYAHAAFFTSAAISQAYSPKSDPNPPSSLLAMLLQYTNITGDRAEIWMTSLRQSHTIWRITMMHQ
jgi:hypothetical protein